MKGKKSYGENHNHFALLMENLGSHLDLVRVQSFLA